MVSGVISNARITARQFATLFLTLDNAKSALFYYVLFSQAVKVQRHLRARGITTSAKEVYGWISQVCPFQ